MEFVSWPLLFCKVIKRIVFGFSMCFYENQDLNGAIRKKYMDEDFRLKENSAVLFAMVLTQHLVELC